ncbi:hypothetical protein SLEP1_g29717 [Rubroshorea leprosula]|uniref:Reverse transcriptase Ty1/copia-type domain-containing protein n=1 Tax=Rubroshorea leprosula TaxID=152421 RepID=A0AAV5K4D0_9ROSI|nr:hypothetical protein SLEP1_g29717 [Rubroshorea leprosula]
MPISIETRLPLRSSPASTWQGSHPTAAASSDPLLGLFPTTITVPSTTNSLSSHSVSPSRPPSLSQTPSTPSPNSPDSPNSPKSPITHSSPPSPTPLPPISPASSPAHTGRSRSPIYSTASPPSSLTNHMPAPASSSPLQPIDPPIRTHPMVTRSQNQIFKPKQLYLAETPCSEVEPTCVSQALKDHRWRQAMSEEFTALVSQGTWDLVPPAPNQNIIGCKWVFRLKRGKDGRVERYKARLVAKGFHKQPGTDYTQTFSPVIKPTTIRAILSIAVSRGWKIHQLDINNAFLHGKLDEQLFMQQPARFIDPHLPHHVCRLQKSLYGLKQAPRMWFRELKQFLLAHGLTNSRSDCSLFIYCQNTDWLYVLVYVDDILITGSNPVAIDNLITAMSSKFSVKNLGELDFFLGVEAIRTNAGLFLSQQRYIQDILQRAGMDNAKAVSTPLSSTTSLRQFSGHSLTDPTAYRQIVGSLQYLSLTRPDLCFAVNRLSQFMHNPIDLHWQAVKRVLRYLNGTKFHGLLLRPQTSLSLHGFSDADWAGDKDTSISTTGYVMYLGSSPVSWKATKQRVVARSSTEAEYKALAAASSEMVWILNLLHELGIHPSTPPALYCDNIGATYLSSNPVMHSRMKHIAIDLHFVRDLVDHKVLRVSHISSKDQFADGLTKPLSSARFTYLRSKIGVTDGSSILRGRVKEKISAISS